VGLQSPSAEPELNEILAKLSATQCVVLSVPSYLTIPLLVAGSDLVATVPSVIVDGGTSFRSSSVSRRSR
jgi:hypothetical protein